MLSGPQGSQLELMQRYQQISELLYSSGLRLTALELSARGSWQLMINEEYQVVVGRDQVMERLQRFLDFYNAEPAMRSALIESVDLRYDNGVAVEFTAEDVTELAVR